MRSQVRLEGARGTGGRRAVSTAIAESQHTRAAGAMGPEDGADGKGRGAAGRAFNPRRRTGLADAGTPALDQESQHNEEQHSGDDANDCNVVHVRFSFLSLAEVFAERICHENRRRSKRDQEQAGKNEDHERKDQLDGRLGGSFFH